MQISKKQKLNSLALAGLGVGAAGVGVTGHASADSTQALSVTSNANGATTTTQGTNAPSQADVDNLNAQMRSLHDLASGLVSFSGDKQTVSAGDVKTLQDGTSQLQQLVTQYNNLVAQIRAQNQTNASLNGQVAFTNTTSYNATSLSDVLNDTKSLVSQMQSIADANKQAVANNAQLKTVDDTTAALTKQANATIAKTVQNMINYNAGIRGNMDAIKQKAAQSSASNGVQVDTTQTDKSTSVQTNVKVDNNQLSVKTPADVQTQLNNSLNSLEQQRNTNGATSASDYSNNGLKNIDDVNNWLNQQRQTIANTKTAQDQANTAVNTVRAYQIDALNKLNDMLQKAQAAGATSYQLKAIQSAITSVKNSNIYQTTNLGQLGQSNPYDFGNIGKGADEQNGSQDGSINNTKSTESTKLNNDAQSKLAQVTASNNTTLNRIKTALDNNVSNANKVYQEVLSNATRTNVTVPTTNYNSNYASNQTQATNDSMLQANQLSVQVNAGRNNVKGVSFAQWANAYFQYVAGTDSFNNSGASGVGSVTIPDGNTANSVHATSDGSISNRADNNDLNSLSDSLKNTAAVKNALNQGDTNAVQVVSTGSQVQVKLPNSLVYRDDDGNVHTTSTNLTIDENQGGNADQLQAAVQSAVNAVMQKKYSDDKAAVDAANQAAIDAYNKQKASVDASNQAKTDAYNQQKSAVDAANAQAESDYQAKKAQVDADNAQKLADYQKAMDAYNANQAANQGKDGYVNQNIQQELLLNAEDNSSATDDVNSLTSSDGWPTVNANNHTVKWHAVTVPSGKTITITYTNLTASLYGDTKVSKIVRTLTPQATGTSDTGFYMMWSDDPSLGFWYTGSNPNSDNSVSKSPLWQTQVKATDTLYDSNNQPIVLNGDAYAVATSLNSAYIDSNDDNGESNMQRLRHHIEQVQVDGATAIPINGSSIVTHDNGFAYADHQDKNFSQTWDSSTSPYRYYGSIIYKLASGTSSISYTAQTSTTEPNCGVWFTLDTSNMPVPTAPKTPTLEQEPAQPTPQAEPQQPVLDPEPTYPTLQPEPKEEDYKVDAQVNYLTTLRVNQNTGQLGVSNGIFLSRKGTNTSDLQDLNQGGVSSVLNGDDILNRVLQGQVSAVYQVQYGDDQNDDSYGYEKYTPLFVSGGNKQGYLSSDLSKDATQAMNASGSDFINVNGHYTTNANTDGTKLSDTNSTQVTDNTVIEANEASGNDKAIYTVGGIASNSLSNNNSLFAPFGIVGAPELNIAQINGQVDNMTFADAKAKAHTDGTFNTDLNVQYLNAYSNGQPQAIQSIAGMITQPTFTGAVDAQAVASSNTGMTVTRRSGGSNNTASGQGMSITNGTARNDATASGNSFYVKRNGNNA